MNDELHLWIAECIDKGTFASRADAIEFCVGATRAFCEVNHLDQAQIKDAQERAAKQTGPGPQVEIPLAFPLKWSREIDEWLRKTGAAPPFYQTGARTRGR